MPNDVKFRDYQLDAIKSVFDEFGLEPAGPSDDQIVSHCRGDRTRQDGDNGGASESLADRSSDVDVAPIRDQPAVNRTTQLDLF